MRVLSPTVLWFVAPVAILLIVFVTSQWLDHYYLLDVHHASGTLLFLGSPGLLALWVLAFAARYASRPASVLATAVASGILILAQGAVLGFAIAWSRGLDSTRSTTHLQILLAGVLVAGTMLTWWFVRSRPSHRQDMSRR